MRAPKQIFAWINGCRCHVSLLTTITQITSGGWKEQTDKILISEHYLFQMALKFLQILISIQYTFFFIRTPNFSPRLDVLIFSAISASDVLINVFIYFSIKIVYLYSTTVHWILNKTVFSLRYNIK